MHTVYGSKNHGPTSRSLLRRLVTLREARTSDKVVSVLELILQIYTCQMAYRCFLQCDLYQQKTGNHLNPWRDWLKKLYLHTMEYSTATQQNEIAVCVLTRHTYGDKILMKKARYRVGCLANNLLCKKKYVRILAMYTHIHMCIERDVLLEGCSGNWLPADGGHCLAGGQEGYLLFLAQLFLHSKFRIMNITN